MSCHQTTKDTFLQTRLKRIKILDHEIFEVKDNINEGEHEEVDEGPEGVEREPEGVEGGGQG